MTSPKSSTRGDQTREALLIAAIEIFGRDGFHAASTRAIAGAAGVNQALIGYHFRGKQGLYLAVFESIATQMTANVLPVVEDVARELDSMERRTAEVHSRALLCLERVMSALVSQFCRVSAGGWPSLLVREQQNPTEAFEILYERFWRPLLAVITPLVGVLLAVHPASATARSRAMMILGQVIIFIAARGTATRQMQWDALGPAELEVVREEFLHSLRAQFKGESVA